MVDEFQDTNPLQVELFGLVGRRQRLRRRRRAAVDLRLPPRRRRGVPRAAAPSSPREGRAAELTTNFRSRAPVIDARQRRVRRALRDGFRPLVAGPAPARRTARRASSCCVTGRGRLGGRRPRRAARASQPWRHAEARLLAQRVAELVADEGVAPEDVVVLLRAATDMPVYERALEEAGPADARRRRPRLLGASRSSATCAAASPRWPTRATRRAARRAGLAAGRPARRRAGAPGPRRARRRSGSGARAAEDRRRRLRCAPDDARARSRRSASASPPSAARCRGWGSTSCCAARSRPPATTCTSCACPAARGGWPTSTSSCASRPSYEARHGRDVRGFIDRATAELEADAREPDAPVELGDRAPCG